MDKDSIKSWRTQANPWKYFVYAYANIFSSKYRVINLKIVSLQRLL